MTTIDPYAEVATDAADPRVSLAERVRAWPRAGAGVRLTTGVPTLDGACRGGFVAPRTIIVGGAPGAAKTSFVVGLAHRWAKHGYVVAMYAVDEDLDDILQRIGQLEGLDRFKLERRDEETIESLARALERMPNLEIFDGDEETLETAFAWIDQHRRADAPAVFVGDSVQTIRTERTDEITSVRERIDDVVKTVKRYVRSLGLVAIVTSEIARSFYRNTAQLEDLNDLAAFKESGGIEYGAKTALLMRSVKDADDLFDVGMPKNRGGKKRTFRLKIDLATTALLEIALPPEELTDDGAREKRKDDRRMERVERDAEKLLAALTKLATSQGKGLTARSLRELGASLGFGTRRAAAAASRLESSQRITNLGGSERRQDWWPTSSVTGRDPDVTGHTGHGRDVTVTRPLRAVTGHGHAPLDEYTLPSDSDPVTVTPEDDERAAIEELS